MDRHALPLTDAQKKLLEAWGFDKSASPELIELAAMTAEIGGMRVGQVVAHMGLANTHEVEALLLEKPDNQRVLDYLAGRIDGLRQNIQRILAMQDGLPYFTTLPDPHSALTDPLIQTACNSMSATLVNTPSGRPCLVFAEHDDQKVYGKTGLAAQLEDPIRRYFDGETPILALGNRAAILGRLTQDEQSTVISDTKVIRPSDAKTEAQKLLIRILEYTIEKRASNIAIQPTPSGLSAVRMRLNGDMIPMPICRTLNAETASEIANVLHQWSTATYTDTHEHVTGTLLAPAGGQFTYATSADEVFWRASFMRPDSLGGHRLESISLRRLPRDIRRIDLADLNLNQAVIDATDDAVREDNGLILLVGGTGSGKSTTIHGMLGKHQEIFGDTKNRLSAENPVERFAPNLCSFSVDKRNTYDLLMSEILRQDPDVIYIGEIRDRDSASIAVRASNSGHLVFSTLHANSSLDAIPVLGAYIANKNVGTGTGVIVSEFDMVSSLSLIVSQRLVSHLCPHCSVKTTLAEQKALLERIVRFGRKKGTLPFNFGISSNQDEQTAHKALQERIVKALMNSHKANPEGCKHCDGGHIGELPINDILIPDYRFKSMAIKMLSSGNFDTNKLRPYLSSSLFDNALLLIEAGQASADILTC